MVSPGNQHCANCIGTLSFPIVIIEANNGKIAERNTWDVGCVKVTVIMQIINRVKILHCSYQKYKRSLLR